MRKVLISLISVLLLSPTSCRLSNNQDNNPSITLYSFEVIDTVSNTNNVPRLTIEKMSNNLLKHSYETPTNCSSTYGLIWNASSDTITMSYVDIDTASGICDTATYGTFVTIFSIIGHQKVCIIDTAYAQQFDTIIQLQ
jgi:hypothetical protein